MKNTLLYSAIVLLLAAAACNKTDGVVREGDGFIRFAPAAEETRALVYQSTLNAETFRVYDFKDGEKYIDNKIKYGTTGWVYVDEEDYLWKATEHNLFGYSDGLGALPENKKVALEAVMTTSLASGNQVDYLYSEIVNTTADAWKHTTGNTKDTPVKLNMKHLFTAVSMGVKNAKSSEIVLTSVTIPAIAGNGSATIDYSGSAVNVQYTGPTVAETPFVSAAAAANAPLSAGGIFDLLTQSVATPTPYVVWPQTIPASTVTVNYTMNGNSYVATAAIPSVKWEAGKLNTYLLSINNADDIMLTFTVKDWQEGATENYEFE